MENKVLIKEIFESIQGEGTYIGYNQLFIRFSKCNLNCSYCDTDFKNNLVEYSEEKFIQEINKHNNIHSISLTGGEPLLDADFLMKVLPRLNKKIYLETNGTLPEELKKIISYIDIISMDIKLNSTSNNGNFFNIHKEFIDIAISNNKEIFAKVVFDEHITNEEIVNTINIVQTYNIPIILQPKMDGENLNLTTQTIEDIFCKFIQKYNNVRLIPQVHKFLNVR